MSRLDELAESIDFKGVVRIRTSPVWFLGNYDRGVLFPHRTEHKHGIYEALCRAGVFRFLCDAGLWTSHPCAVPYQMGPEHRGLCLHRAPASGRSFRREAFGFLAPRSVAVMCTLQRGAAGLADTYRYGFYQAYFLPDE